MKTSRRTKQTEPSREQLERMVALFACGPELGGYENPPVSFYEAVNWWFLQKLEKLQKARTKVPTIIEQVTICWPTPPGAWGDRLLTKVLRKQSLGPVFYMDAKGQRQCQPFERKHAERPQHNYVELGIVCNLEDEFIDDMGKRRQIGEFIGVFDSTKSSLHPGNVTVFRAGA